MLFRSPIDTIKVDRSFIRELESSREDRAITDAIIAMGNTLRMTIVAEGVEKQSQIDFLKGHGCDEFQGFYFSKAVPPGDISQLLVSRPWAGPTDPVRSWGREGTFPDSALLPI